MIIDEKDKENLRSIPKEKLESLILNMFKIGGGEAVAVINDIVNDHYFNEMMILNYHMSIEEHRTLLFKIEGNQRRYDVIEYLIFNFNIPKTLEIEDYIKYNPRLIKAFEMRQLSDKLNKELKINKDNNKTTKV